MASVNVSIEMHYRILDVPGMASVNVSIEMH